MLAAEGVASPGREGVGAHDVGGGAQGHGVALQLEASRREAGRGHGALALGAHQEVAQRGQGGLQQHLAQGGKSPLPKKKSPPPKQKERGEQSPPQKKREKGKMANARGVCRARTLAAPSEIAEGVVVGRCRERQGGA